MMELLNPAEEIKDFIDVYYYPNGEDFPTQEWFPVPTLIRPWLIFCIDGNAKILIDDKEFIPPKISLKGPFDHPYLFGYTQEKISAVLVQFSITGLYELTGINVNTIKNSYPEACTVWDKKTIDQLNLKLSQSKNIEDQINSVNQFFIKQKNERGNHKISDKSAVVKNVLNYAQQEKFALTLSDISDHLKISTKKIERDFKTVTGITPKKYFAGCLFEELIRELIMEKDKRVSEIMNSPFYDFSHINKWFSKYANLPPSTFNKQQYHTLETIMKYQNQF